MGIELRIVFVFAEMTAGEQRELGRNGSTVREPVLLRRRERLLWAKTGWWHAKYQLRDHYQCEYGYRHVHLNKNVNTNQLNN